MPYWMQSTLAATPAFLWVYLGIGVPFALALLPRNDWRDRPLVLMTAFALGSGVLTAFMFVLGSFNQPLLTQLNMTIGLVALTVIGLGAFWYKRNITVPTSSQTNSPLTPIEWTIITLIAGAFLVRWVVIGYWPFTAYDALWVYGYEGRLYLLEGFIPSNIGYYPQFLPLQFTFGQIMVGGAIDDHAARAVIPLLHLGSILAAYNLGNRNFNRQTGILLAGLWALYPAVGAWARMGDLEIPLTFLITATATFFFMAWHGERPRHYAIIAGLIYGLALWTKPTAGAFALGVILLNVIEAVRVKFQWADYHPRFMVSLWTAIACVPLGGVWYIRNILIGHNAVDFPPRYWHSLAERGGGQFLWYLLALLVGLLYLYTRQGIKPNTQLIGIGLALVLLGIVPSATARFWDAVPDTLYAVIFPSLVGLPRLGWVEGIALLLGTVLLSLALWQYIHTYLNGRAAVGKVSWIVACTIPYFIVFFWLYSYHYRLAFAIVPMMAVPTAVVLANWLTEQRTIQFVLSGFVALLALPALVIPLNDKFLGWNYLWSGELNNDVAKLTSGNEALMWMVDGFWKYEQEHGGPPVVSAPGVQRLPFFFPQADIRIDEAPTTLAELHDVTYFVDSHPDGTGAYERSGVPTLNNQVLSALGRQDIMRRAWWENDGIFRYEIYELNVEERFIPKQPLAAADGDIVFGDFVQFLGHEISSTTFQIGQRRTVKLFWHVLDHTENNYMTYIHLRDSDDNVQMAWDGPVALTEDGRYYTTLVWEPGEYIVDERLLQLTNFDAPIEDDYSIVIGLYNLTTGERVQVMRNGTPIGDGYRLAETLVVTPPEDD